MTEKLTDSEIKKIKDMGMEVKVVVICPNCEEVYEPAEVLKTGFRCRLCN